MVRGTRYENHSISCLRCSAPSQAVLSYGAQAACTTSRMASRTKWASFRVHKREHGCACPRQKKSRQDSFLSRYEIPNSGRNERLTPCGLQGPAAAPSGPRFFARSQKRGSLSSIAAHSLGRVRVVMSSVCPGKRVHHDGSRFDLDLNDADFWPALREKVQRDRRLGNQVRDATVPPAGRPSPRDLE